MSARCLSVKGIRLSESTSSAARRFCFGGRGWTGLVDSKLVDCLTDGWVGGVWPVIHDMHQLGQVWWCQRFLRRPRLRGHRGSDGAGEEGGQTGKGMTRAWLEPGWTPEHGAFEFDGALGRSPNACAE